MLLLIHSFGLRNLSASKGLQSWPKPTVTCNVRFRKFSLQFINNSHDFPAICGLCVCVCVCVCAHTPIQHFFTAKENEHTPSHLLLYIAQNGDYDKKQILIFSWVHGHSDPSCRMKADLVGAINNAGLNHLEITRETVWVCKTNVTCNAILYKTCNVKTSQNFQLLSVVVKHISVLCSIHLFQAG